MKLKDACFLEEKLCKPRQDIKKQRHHFADKDPYSQSYGFSTSHVWMWELDHDASWAFRNWCLWIVVMEKTLESPLDCKEIKPVNSKEINPEYLLELLMLKPKLQYFGHLMQRADSLEKTLMLEDWGQEEKGTTEWVGWIESLTQWTWIWANSRDKEGQGSL